MGGVCSGENPRAFPSLLVQYTNQEICNGTLSSLLLFYTHVDTTCSAKWRHLSPHSALFSTVIKKYRTLMGVVLSLSTCSHPHAQQNGENNFSFGGVQGGEEVMIF